MGLKGLINANDGQAVVNSITGTANEIIVSSPTGAVTLSTPQAIATTSSPTFATVTLTGAALSQKPVVANSGSAYTIDQANGAQFDITLNAATPVLTLQTVTSSESEVLAVTLIQDGTGGRVPSWANVTWAAGTPPTVSAGATSRTYLSFVSDGTTWTGYAIAQSTGAGSVVLATSPTITTPLLASGFSSTPTDSHTATTAFGNALTLGTAIHNTTGYDLIANVGIAVTAATAASIIMGVGPTSTPTTDTVVPSFSTSGAFTVTAYVPNNYYLLVNTSGTITVSANKVVVTPA